VRRTSRPTIVRALAAFAAFAALSGCGPILYTVNALEAGEAVEQARQAGAATNAPYEYWYAFAHLEHAREEAGDGDYQRAQELLGTATQYGNRARDLARRRGQESGRR